MLRNEYDDAARARSHEDLVVGDSGGVPVEFEVSS